VSPGYSHFALTPVTMCCMDKKDAIKLLGGTPAKAATAMGYQTVHAIYMWPDTLPLGMVDRVHGALLRIKTERRLARAAARMGGQNKPQLSGDGK
jgi:hypothetical protein